jgi:hypothetical protein
MDDELDWICLKAIVAKLRHLSGYLTEITKEKKSVIKADVPIEIRT